MCIRDRLYADLKIGTAAPTPEQLARVPHYFVGTLQLTGLQYERLPPAKAVQALCRPVADGLSDLPADASCEGADAHDAQADR